MKKTLTLFLLFLFATSVAQPLPNSLKTKYQKATTSQQKAEVILDIDRPSNADSLKTVQTMQLRDWFKKNNDELGTTYTELYIASIFLYKGDGNISLKMVLPLLKKFEKENDEYGKMRCYQVIGMSYSDSKSYDLSFLYLKKAIAIGVKHKYTKFLSIVYNSIGVIYCESGHPEKGIEYAQKALQLDTNSKDFVRLPVSLSTVGENYMALQSYDLALPFLRRALNLNKNNKKNTYADAYIHNDLAQAFLGLKQIDSAVFYANRGVQKSAKYKPEKLRSYEYLLTIFKITKQQDSLNKYYPLLIKTKEELYNFEKLRSVENSNFVEQLRQQKIKEDLLKTESERHQNIQYAFIATGIITFFILFLLLSRTVIVNEKWISFLAILALLLVFEFINLLIHPFLEEITHHSPILMLLCLVALASLLIPLHHKLEHWIKEKMTEKNKAIRLANAKKTIEELEKENK